MQASTACHVSHPERSAARSGNWISLIMVLVLIGSSRAADLDLHSATRPAVPVTEVGRPEASPLTLRELFEGVQATHPGLQAARLQARAARQEVSATERLRWPTFSVVAESDRSGNNRVLAPTKLLTAEQPLWDFGRISGKVAESEASAKVSATQSELTRQDLFLQVINAWQQLTGGLAKQRVAAKALQLLKGYQTQMARRVQAQASSQIDLELVTARVLQTEVELTAARTQIFQAATRLEQLSGLRQLSVRARAIEPPPTEMQIAAFARLIEQADWVALAREHTLVDKARLEREVLESRLASKEAELMPQVYFRVSKPLEATVTVPSTDPSYFVGLRFTPSAGFAGHMEAQALASRLQSQALNVEVAQRDLLQTLLNDREEFFNTRLRIQGLDQSVKGSELVLDSYLRQFQAGRKSWLDLLNSARELAQNEYAQAEARVAMAAAMQRLQVRMGQPSGQP